MRVLVLPGLLGLTGCSLFIAAGPAFRTPTSVGGELSMGEGIQVAGASYKNDARSPGHATYLDTVGAVGGTTAGAYGTISLGLDELFSARNSPLRLKVGPRVGVRVTGGPTSELALGTHVLLVHERHGDGDCADSFHDVTVQQCAGIGVDLDGQLLAGRGLSGVVALLLVADVTAL